MADEQPLHGGTVTPVVRIGDTVRRRPDRPRPNVHTLLRILADAGIDAAPRFLGLDDQGREVLSFIPGDVTADGPPHGMHSDDALIAAARLLRRCHDASATLATRQATGWRFQPGAPTAGPVVCHNDVGPYNTIYRSGLPVAFIDWDLAAPAPRAWDVAYALWRFVPLYDDARCADLGWPVQPRGPRIALFLDAYGLRERSDILDVLDRRQQSVSRTIEHWATADPAYARLLAEGRPAEIDRDRNFARRLRPEWRRVL